MTQAAENNNIMELFATLPTEKQYTLYGWQMCLFAGSGIFSYIFMMYFPFLTNSTNNAFLRPFVAFYNSIKFLFKNFLSSVGLYFLIYVSYTFLSILRALTEGNIIISLILFFVYIYFLTFIVMLIFNYYETKNNSPDRCDSIGKNETINPTSQEN